MIFNVRRTSDMPHDYNKRPCDAAFELKTGWCIEFRALEGLMAFVRKEGQIVLSDGAIEIYDEDRE